VGIDTVRPERYTGVRVPGLRRRNKGEQFNSLNMDTEWTKRAACKGMTELFIPSKQTYWAELEENQRYAKKICADCLVNSECLEYALAHPAKHIEGIWAGTTEKERRALRRQRDYDARTTRKHD
jgi:WhiB family redox-sensing transcriptional regulator